MHSKRPYGFIRHAQRWVYWNGKLYYFQDPRHFRALYKSLKPFKKFGITNPFIVYQMSKVGSSTIVTSLHALDLDVPIYHIHFLNDLDGIEKSTRAAHADPREAVGVIQEGRALRRQIDSQPGRKWNIVCLVRLPISRDVSSFFQALDAYIPNALAQFADRTLTVEILRETFLQKHYHGTDEYWFDMQVAPVFDIDVYATSFPKHAGYRIYDSRRARLLLIRLEDLNRVASRAFQDAFQIPHFELVRANIGQEKAYNEIYRDFQKDAQMPDSYLDTMLNTRFANHFYTSEELQTERARWSAQTTKTLPIAPVP